MPRDRQEWARPVTDPPNTHVYHWVNFGPGPNVQEVTAACGLVARFWPRIGVRINDRNCSQCTKACAE